MPSSKGKPQPDYDDKFKAVAVARLYLEGYPEFPGALRKVSAELGITHQTLSRWAKGTGTAVPPALIAMAVDAMGESIDSHLEKILQEMDAKRGDASFKDLALTFGILFDKRQLLRGAPTHRTETIHSDLRDRPTEELERMIAAAEEHARNVIDVTPKSGASGASEADPGHEEDASLHEVHLPQVLIGSVPSGSSSGA